MLYKLYDAKFETSSRASEKVRVIQFLMKPKILPWNVRWIND
jgi:hypothetical protein